MEFQKEDKHLKDAIKDLPQVSPREDTWEGIGQMLDSQQGTSAIKVNYRLIAAIALIIMVSSYFLVSIRSAVEENIRFSEELGINEGFSPEGLLEDVAFDDFLAQECSGVNEVCEDENLLQLLDQLEALRSEAVEMVALINATGYDEYLMKAKSRLERENAQVKREIMELIRG